MNKINEVARNLLESARRIPNFPEAQLVIVNWKGKEYFGSIQQAYSEFPDVVYLSKTSKPIAKELADSIRKLEQLVLCMNADSNLDLEGRGHILRRLEDKLAHMTPEQTNYALENPLNIIELNQ